MHDREETQRPDPATPRLRSSFRVEQVRQTHRTIVSKLFPESRSRSAASNTLTSD